MIIKNSSFLFCLKYNLFVGPPSPSFEDKKADNSSIRFKLLIRPRTPAVDGIIAIITKFGDSKNEIVHTKEALKETYYNFGNLTAGQCYSINAYSLIGNNTSVQPAQTTICTSK